MSDDRNDDDDKVGYRNPPKHTRFKKGQSGNPQGRPKKPKNLLTLFERMLEQKITITINGKPCRVTIREAIVHRILHGALNGEHKSLSFYMKYINDSKQLRHEEKQGGGVLVVPKELTIEEWMEKHGPEQAKYRGEEDDDDDNDH